MLEFRVGSCYHIISKLCNFIVVFVLPCASSKGGGFQVRGNQQMTKRTRWVLWHCEFWSCCIILCGQTHWSNDRKRTTKESKSGKQNFVCLYTDTASVHPHQYNEWSSYSYDRITHFQLLSLSTPGMIAVGLVVVVVVLVILAVVSKTSLFCKYHCANSA